MEVEFIRGTVFTCTAFIPDTVPPGFFKGWTLKSQLRRKGDSTDLGLIAELDVSWDDPETTQQLNFYCKDTSNWPLGEAEMDTLLISSDDEPLATSRITFKIKPGITRK